MARTSDTEHVPAQCNGDFTGRRRIFALFVRRGLPIIPPRRERGRKTGSGEQAERTAPRGDSNWTQSSSVPPETGQMLLDTAKARTYLGKSPTPAKFGRIAENRSNPAVLVIPKPIRRWSVFHPRVLLGFVRLPGLGASGGLAEAGSSIGVRSGTNRVTAIHPITVIGQPEHSSG